MGGTPGSAALQTIFGVLQGIAGDIQSGLLTVVAPIAIAVCLYFLVRMLLASAFLCSREFLIMLKEVLRPLAT